MVVNFRAPMYESDIGALGAEITMFEPSRLDAGWAAEVRDLVYRYKVVVFRGMTLPADEYVDFARALGTPQIYFQDNYHHPEHPEIFVSANVPLRGEKVGVAGTGRYWHTDYQFFEEPLPMTMVYPQQLPNGPRYTAYIDMQRVYECLPEHLRKRLDGATAIHDAKYQYKIQPKDIDRSIAELLRYCADLVPPVRHPAVITHPVTKAPALYMSPGFTAGLEGLSYEDNQAFMAELFAFVTDERHVIVHHWSPGDILLWDNRVLLHRASETQRGQASVSFRIGVYDGVPFYSQPSTEPERQTA